MSTDLDGLRGALLRWYARVRRDLPWRRTTDPYAILVSEVMLQQTQVARVVPRYLEWIKRWPTADALAAASRAEVLAAWVGLGYNRRALALHAAAAAVARDGWPADLRTLPGVGPYTAAAVALVRVRRPGRRGRHERRGAWPSGWATGRRAALLPPGARRRLEPGGDGARRDGLHGAGAALRRLPGGARGARRAGRAAVAPRAARGARRVRALRGLATAGSAAASSRRSRRGRGCPATSPRSDSSARSRGWSATGSSVRRTAASR